MLKLDIIVASTRPGRMGLPIAEWVHGVAAKHPAWEPVLVDLKTIALPMFDEPNHPRLKRYEHDHTKAFSAIIDAADAFVIVTPEYNFSTPPALANAFTYLFSEWGYKPVSYVSYGGVSGGLRSVQMQKLTASALKMVPLNEGVTLPFAANHVKDGAFHAEESHQKAAGVMLDELARWATALKTMRV